MLTTLFLAVSNSLFVFTVVAQDAVPHGAKHRGILSLAPVIPVLIDILLSSWNRRG
jgi:hypothetical protein